MESEEDIFISAFFKEFGQKVKDFRLNEGLTLEQLGFEIGLDKSAMFHIENGRPITMTTFLKIARALKIQPKELIPDTSN